MSGRRGAGREGRRSRTAHDGTSGLDRETRLAVEALAYRIRERDAAVRQGDADLSDADVFAREFIVALLGRGLRLTPARTVSLKEQLHGGAGLPVGQEARDLLAAYRAQAAADAATEAGAS